MLGEKTHRLIFTSALCLLVLSLPLSRFGMSLAQFILIGNWLIGDHPLHNFRRLFENKILCCFVSLIALYFFGLLYSENVETAWGELRVKLPLLSIPVVIATSRFFNTRVLQLSMRFLLTGVFMSSLVSAMIMAGFIDFAHDDIRDVSPFISHLRLSVLISWLTLALTPGLFRFFPESFKWRKWTQMILSLWFIVFLFWLESVTGIVLTAAGFVSLLIFKPEIFGLKKLRRKLVLVTVLIGVIGLGFAGFCFVYNNINYPGLDVSELDEKTTGGVHYYHVNGNNFTENGHYTYSYICNKELLDSWNKRSSRIIPEDRLTEDNIYGVLIRYMTSKGLRKDSIGVSKLSNVDVRNIEQLIPNYEYTKYPPFVVKALKVLWEIKHYLRGANPEGNSVTQRFLFWQAGMEVIKQSPLIGFGSGDLKTEMSKAYEKINKGVSLEYRKKPHNQYLTVLIQFGLIGLLWMLFAIWYPAFRYRKHLNAPFFLFLLIYSASMVTEDALDTQAGITIFTTIYSLFMFLPKPASNEK